MLPLLLAGGDAVQSPWVRHRSTFARSRLALIPLISRPAKSACPATASVLSSFPPIAPSEPASGKKLRCTCATNSCIEAIVELALFGQRARSRCIKPSERRGSAVLQRRIRPRAAGTDSPRARSGELRGSWSVSSSRRCVGRPSFRSCDRNSRPEMTDFATAHILRPIRGNYYLIALGAHYSIGRAIDDPSGRHDHLPFLSGSYCVQI